MHELTSNLIDRLRSEDNLVALDAVKMLRAFDRLGALRGETLIRVNLTGADLAHADLCETVLIWANLRKARLQEAKMCGAVLFRADLASADLSRANLERAYLLKANLANAYLINAKFDRGTTLPDGSAWSLKTDITRFTDPNHPDFWRDNDPTSPAYSSYPGSHLIQ